MIKMEENILINRPIKEVFSYVSNIDKWDQWQSDIIEVKITSKGPVDVSTTFKFVATLMNKRIDATGEITEFSPDKIFSFKSITGPFGVTGSYTFEAVDKATKITQLVEAEVKGFFKLCRFNM